MTAGNGVRSTTETITVTVDPGTPVVGTPTTGTPNTSTGVVTGSAVLTDTAGRTLTYSTSATSTGGAALSINAATGAFTYTPTQAQRQAATGSTTDTFTVTADNGVRSITQTITVTVDPGIPVADSSPQFIYNSGLDGKNFVYWPTDATFTADVLNSNLPAMVLFTATWDYTWKKFAPIWDQATAGYVGQINFFMIDIDDSPNVTSQYRIRSVPTWSIFKAGQVLYTRTALVTLSQIIQAVDTYL